MYLSTLNPPAPKDNFLFTASRNGLIINFLAQSTITVPNLEANQYLLFNVTVSSTTERDTRKDYAITEVFTATTSLTPLIIGLVSDQSVIYTNGGSCIAAVSNR